MNVYSEFSSDTDYTSILYDKGKCIPLVINVLEEVSIAPNIPILGEKLPFKIKTYATSMRSKTFPLMKWRLEFGWLKSEYLSC